MFDRNGVAAAAVDVSRCAYLVFTATRLLARLPIAVKIALNLQNKAGLSPHGTPG